MKKNRPYQGTSVKNVCINQVVRGREGMQCDVGFDTSKDELFVTVRWLDESFERPWIVKMTQLRILVQKLNELKQGREMVIAMEPTGSYCDPVRQTLHDAGFEVYRVSPKASHDYSEIFDGVPSQHDGKDSACVAELSAMRKRKLWPWDATECELRHEIEWMDANQQDLTRWLGRMEGLLARFWPEVTNVLKLSSSTLLKALAHYGGPRGLAADPEASARLKRWGGGQLKPTKIERLIACAKETLGVRQEEADIRQVQRFAEQALTARSEVNDSKKKVQRLTQNNPVVQRQAKVVGPGTAAVLWAHLRDPSKYHCGNAYRKAMGLNLKVRSSGRWKGHLKITKRGPSRARRWLYFAALRYCQDPWVKPWYEAKKKRGDGYAKRALVTLMRKLALALYHIGTKDVAFDVRKLLPGAAKYHKKRRALA